MLCFGKQNVYSRVSTVKDTAAEDYYNKAGLILRNQFHTPTTLQVKIGTRCKDERKGISKLGSVELSFCTSVLEQLYLSSFVSPDHLLAWVSSEWIGSHKVVEARWAVNKYLKQTLEKIFIYKKI